MRHAIWVIACTAIAMAVWANPAQAAISGATISTSKPSYNGSCPATVAFTGLITGSPGTVFTYSFNRFFNGVQQVVSGGTVTIKGSGLGAYPVSDSFPISASTTSGRTFDQIWVHNISGGQTDVYSNEAHFTVTCAVPTSERIPAPTQLANTVDTITCGQHAGLGGLFCPGALHTGYLVLVWNYENKDESKIDGYHVYQVSTGYNDRVNTQDIAQATIAFLKPIKGGFGTQCYEVAAFKGKKESERSNKFCVPEDYKYNGPSTIPRVFTLQQSSTMCKSEILPYRGSAAKGYAGYRYPSSVTTGCSAVYFHGGILMGNFHYANNVGTYTTSIIRTAVAYDLPSLKGLRIFRATLLLKHPLAQNTNNVLIDPGAAHEGYECYGGLGMVTAPWPPASDLKTFFSEDSSTYPTKQNFNVESAEAGSSSIDVTRVVQAWASGETPNYGFVFRETNPNVDTTRTHACYQFFDARPVLSIEAY